MRIRRVGRIAVGLLALSAAFVHAQDTASLTGTVRDSSGAVVAGAQVVVTNTEHAINRTTVANSDGEYSVAALPAPSSYNITVTAQGFKKFLAKGVVLDVARKARLDVALQVGTASTEVTVEGTSVAQVDTESSDLGDTISGKEVTQLELNGRDFTSLVGLSPGVTNQSGSDEGEPGASTVAFSINGGRTEYNNFEVDGGDMLDNGSNTTLNVYPSIDAIAEVKVLTSNYGAQYGKNGSGTVEVETKSGTRAFHGDVYEFVRNTDFNATQFPNTSVAPYHKNDYGFTIGGPVFIPGHYNTSKQKTFFFWSEEWRKELTPNSFGTVPVPTMAERGGDFTGVCPTPGTNPPDFSNCPSVPGYTNAAGYTPNLNVVPAYTNNVALTTPLSLLIPQPNFSSGALGAGVLDSWTASPSLDMNWREDLFKIDQNISDKVRASFRYIHDSWQEAYPTPLWTDGTSFPTIGTNFNNPGISLVARVTATLSPTLLNEFVASYTADHISTALTGPWQRGTAFGDLGLYDNGFGFNAPEVPGISVTGGRYGSFSEDPGYVPEGAINSNPTVTLRDNITKIIGVHNLTFGGYYIDTHKNELPQPPTGANGILGFSNSGNPNTSGNPYADLLLGNIQSFTQQQLQLKMHNFYKIYEPFFQDDWHATKRLTLNLGLRLSLFGTYRELNNLSFNFDPARYVAGLSGTDPVTGNATGNTPGSESGFVPTPSTPFNGWVQCGVTVGVPKGCMNNHWFNAAPRVGFAFDPFGDGKWAIRAGYGIFYEHMNGNESNTDLLEPYNDKTQTTSVTTTSALPITYSNLNPGLLSAGSPPIIVGSIPSKATWPYVQQWHFDVQHEIARGTVATVSYVGSTGVHLTRAYELNQIAPAALQPGGNPYLPGQVINGGPLAATPIVPGTQFDCSWGPGNDQPGVNIDAYGVPMNAVTSYNTPVPYTPGVAGGPPTGAAVNLAEACGNVSPNAFRPYPGYGSIGRKDQTGSSNYNALEVTVRHTIGGLELNGSYTYSHSIDDSSSANDAGLINTYALNTFRASSNFDQRHTITLAYVYDLPFFKGQHNLAGKLLGGWQWSGITLLQSGTPFSVYNDGNGTIAPGDNAGAGNGSSQIANLGGLSAGSYPDLVGNPRSGVQNSSQPGYGPLLYNPAVFVAPQGLTFGDAGRNILNNPWRTNFDMALLKRFAITESKYFEFRAEAFNVFNHTEFSWLGGDGGSAGSNSGTGNADSSITCYGGANNSAGDPSCVAGVGAISPGFLRPNAAHEPRLLQLALKFYF
ncbi:MAG TPA: carboxypeptidase regulatory-like domain-containing protein [Terriglobales bacterium]